MNYMDICWVVLCVHGCYFVQLSLQGHKTETMLSMNDAYAMSCVVVVCDQPIVPISFRIHVHISYDAHL